MPSLKIKKQRGIVFYFSDLASVAWENVKTPMKVAVGGVRRPLGDHENDSDKYSFPSRISLCPGRASWSCLYLVLVFSENKTESCLWPLRK